MSLRAAIYARYSSESQREASITDQLRLCEERISREGWSRTGLFQDAAISGATPLRPGYQALLAGARRGEFDVVVAEALDRLSRDQEDVAALFKRFQFAGIAIVTLAEGLITSLHVGLKGAMNSIFLKDLADKTRRGLRGRVENQRSGGGNSFGYDVVAGEARRGERSINESEAEIVRRIFTDYAAGMSPKRIALRLNIEGARAPRGGNWSSSTINGNRRRGTGIINNEVYIGRIVWNRLSYLKEPDTGRRRSRLNPERDLVVVGVPEWRIVSDDLWQAVRARQTALAGKLEARQATPFWTKQRPRYLFSGLMRCGVCGGGFSKISANHFGCSTARNKGPTACANLLTIRRDVLERETLEGLRSRLMNPDLFKIFADGFTTEWNRLQAEADGEQQGLKNELEHVRRQIERLVDAITEGTPAAALRDRLVGLEARRLRLEGALATAVVPAPRLHPNLAQVYRRRVAELTCVLEADDCAEARELVRGLVDTITLVPVGGKLRIDVRGELAAILRMAQGAEHARSAGANSDALAVQIKMVAGAGNHRQLTPVMVVC